MNNSEKHNKRIKRIATKFIINNVLDYEYLSISEFVNDEEIEEEVAKCVEDILKQFRKVLNAANMG